MATGLPPPPINDQPGSFTWLEWYRQLRSYISTTGSVPWYVIDFAGSNITDIALRDHNQLQGTQGGTSGEKYHLTAAQHAALAAGDHNDLSAIQGGSTTERYHISEAAYLALNASDKGTWTPTFTGLTLGGVGSTTYSGRYTRIGNVVFYTVAIENTGTATTASTAGTTYCTIPIAATYDDTVQATNAVQHGGNHGGGSSSEVGHLDAATDRCYAPTWSATEDKIILSGKYEV